LASLICLIDPSSTGPKDLQGHSSPRSFGNKVLKVSFDLQGPLQTSAVLSFDKFELYKPRFFVEKLKTSKLCSRLTIHLTASSSLMIQGRQFLLN
jgi:hypothetical protein